MVFHLLHDHQEQMIVQDDHQILYRLIYIFHLLILNLKEKKPIKFHPRIFILFPQTRLSLTEKLLQQIFSYYRLTFLKNKSDRR
jgi:hypothetical protein